jgi:hypothetical protein
MPDRDSVEPAETLGAVNRALSIFPGFASANRPSLLHYRD